jgi:hypothetical protein
VVAVRIALSVLTLALAALASPSSADVPVPLETHCVADETGAAHCSTTVAGTCTYSTVSGDPSSASLACDGPRLTLPVTYECSLGPFTPGGDTDCRATALGCEAHTHIYDVEDALNVYEVSCYGCSVQVHGPIDCPIIGPYTPPPIAASSAAVAPPALPCQSGIAQTWCDATVGPCDLRLTPWTSWGDQYVVSDCRTGGAGPTCHTEVHTQGPLAHEHWCAF